MPTRISILPFADSYYYDYYCYYYYYYNLTLLSAYCVPGTQLSANTTAFYMRHMGHLGGSVG